MSTTETGGLRERKRRATQDAIERGALELAFEHGYENVTVEMICERAVISPRTFFNYAGSKERAVLGIDPPLPGLEQRAAYVAGLGASPLEDLVVALAAAFSALGATDTSTLRKRHQILRENPTLAIKEFARMEEAQHALVDLVGERLAADAHGSQSDPGLVEEARMTVSLALGIAHYLMRDWVTSGLPAPKPSDAATGDGLLRAVALARRVATGRQRSEDR